ncbi:SPT2 chromatin protein domain-containing protein [Phthorimaea operculella]|nr:SPT2 chromatin protein domain-containing protein [Phthorimaea operculella]
MEFRETLLAAQRNQQQKSSENSYYKAKFDPPKKEQRQKDRLSANIQKFLAKKEEEEKRKKLEAQRKREELTSMRDPKALRKIQKTLKVIKSANKSVIQDAVDHDNTAVTLAGADQPDQDDYGYESQEAAAFYQKMMQKYSKIPDEPKFPDSKKVVKRDINGTIERVKHALQHEDDPVPHKRKRRSDAGGDRDRDGSPPSKYEPEKEKKKDEKPEKPKIRKPMPPPMDFNQLLKLAEQKKSEPIVVGDKKPKVESSSEPERLMTKRQRREYEEEMARRQRRLERLEAEKSGKKIPKDDRPVEKERKPEPTGFGRIPKIGEKPNGRHDSPKLHDRDRERDKYDRERSDKYDRERNDKPRDKERVREVEKEREKERADRERLERLKAERDKLDREIDRERLERLKAERDRIDREMERLAREKSDKPRPKLDSKLSDKSKPPVDRSKMSSKEPMRQDLKKPIDLKSQNTYRIDNERKLSKTDGKVVNGHSSQGKPVPKLPQKAPLGKKLDGSPKLNGYSKPENGKRPPENGKRPPENGKRPPENGKRPPEKVLGKRPDDRKPSAQPSSSKPVTNSFDFDKHVGAFKNKARQFPPGDVKRKQQQAKARQRLESDEEYDSEMDDFIDDGDEELDVSSHIKEIFGYDKSKYRYIDDDDDPNMESNFVQVQREEYISKKHGIMEDLEDMRLEAMMKSKKGKKKRRISDDD